MVEELVVILFVSLVVSACIFYAVGFHGEYILFWLVYLVTISIGMGMPTHCPCLPCSQHTFLPSGIAESSIGRPELTCAPLSLRHS